MSDPKLQAFLEDLVAVFAKHRLKLSGMEAPSVYPLTEDDCFVSFCEGNEDLLFDKSDQTGNHYYPRCASTPIPTTAHARLSAAARVARLADEDESALETVDAIEDALRQNADLSEYASLEAVFALAGGGPTHGDFARLMRPIIDAVRNGRVAS